MRLSSITIDADGSPSGYVAWYNHSTETGNIRALRPAVRNGRYGIQRMEMLAIYFALADNFQEIEWFTSGHRKCRQLVISIRSDSKTCIEQLQGTSEIRDLQIQRVRSSIRTLIQRVSQIIFFNHLDRRKNIAGLLLEQKRRKREEESLMLEYQKHY